MSRNKVADSCDKIVRQSCRSDIGLVWSQVLKVAILAEKYAVDYTWYVDTILNLIRIAGDYVSEEVCTVSRLHFRNSRHLSTFAD